MKGLQPFRDQWAVMIAAIVFCLLASSRSFAGSPFYLTAERSFSNTEKPRIRLDFTDTAKPMILRVLRPKNLEKFLDGQLHISRSYEEPVSELNPGHYFVKGLNRLESPLKSFRDMLDLDFRISLTETPVHRAILDTTPRQVASAPEQIIIAAPEGFTLVREYAVDLQYGATAANDLGWWFADTAWGEDEYRIRPIFLDPLPDGLYLVQAVQGKAEAQCLMQVSGLSVQVKQSTEQLVVRVIDRALSPVSGAAVRFRDGRGQWIEVGKKTDAFGEVVHDNPEGVLDGKLIVKAEAPDGRQAFVDTDFIPSVTRDDSVFIVTDRPIFKPGETFFYKGIIRTSEAGGLAVPKFSETDAKVALIDANGKPTDRTAVVPLTGGGSFSGSFALDENQNPGLYRLVAEVDGRPYGGEFRVRDYVKPTFYLELLRRSPTVIPGEKFTGRFRARRYSGGAPKNLKYEVFLYRKKFEAPQWVTEAGGGLFSGSDYLGEVRSTSALTEPKRVYSSVEERMSGLGDPFAPNSWDSAPKIDESAEADFSFQVPKTGQADDSEWVYTLMIRAMDPAGSQAVLTENIYATRSEAHPVLRFSTPVAQVGDKTVTAQIRSTYPDGKTAPMAGGVLEITGLQGGNPAATFAKRSFTTDNRGLSQIQLPELDGKGKLAGVVTLSTLDGKPMKHPAQSLPAVLIVAGADGEGVVDDNREIELYTAKTILSPGETVKVLALLPAGWGKSESGVLWETLSGIRVHETRQTQVKGRSCWLPVEARPEYGTGFYHTVTLPMGDGKYREQTLGFRIVPTSKRLHISVMPERETTDPLKPFRIEFEVKDATGIPSPDTELAVTVVDRAVYAVQPEIRPGILDFFYPLPRMNLSTFYSDALQGYGYADILRKPNFKLGALKSQSKPTKKSMRDTAGWFPHVMTDARGRASVTVNLPANVTEWLVTAIAADPSGRVGEANGKFRTVSDITVEVVAPQFLRDSEEALLWMKTANHLARPVSVRSTAEISGEAALKEGRIEKALTLQGNGEDASSLTLVAKGSTGAAIVKAVIDPRETVHAAGAEEFEIPLKPAAMRQIFSSVREKEWWVAQIPEGAKVREVKVEVSSGLLGAALNAAAVLVSYPYGCTEQLAHSTVPNLVLMDLLRNAGVEPAQLGPLSELLVKAEKNAAIGIRKIIRNQKTNGGFGLWPADPSPSLPVTLLALDALGYAKEFEVSGAAIAYRKGIEYLHLPNVRKLHRGSVLYGYELANLAQIGAGNPSLQDQIGFVERISEKKKNTTMDLVHALKIFDGYGEQTWNRFNQHFRDDTVKKVLTAKLIESLEGFQPDAHVAAVREDTQIFDAMGFGFGIPSTISAAMGILARIKALSPEMEARLKTILLDTMKNGYWISTFETAQVIFNSREILRKEAAAHVEEKNGNGRRLSVVGKDGTALGGLVRIPSGFLGIFKAPGTPERLSELRIEGLEANETARSAVTAEVPFDSVTPESRGMVVERKLYRITPKGSEPFDATRPLRRGDRVVSEVRVRRGGAKDTRAIPGRFLVIEDGIPSLAQTIDEDRASLADAGIQVPEESYWDCIQETHRFPEKTVRIAKLQQTAQLRVFQVWQAAFAGRAVIPPATAFDMYDESLQGNTGAVTIRVE